MPTTITQPASAGKFSKLLTGLSGSRLIRDLILDGNRAARNNPVWDGLYNLEQSSLVWLRDGTYDIDDLTLQNTPADGITVNRDAVVTINDVTADACYRGSLTINGGGSTVTVDNLQGAGGAEPTFINMEIITPSITTPGSLATDLTVTNSHFLSAQFENDGDLDISDTILDAGFWLLGPNNGTGGTAEFTDMDIGLADYHFGHEIYYPQNVKFTRCNFTGPTGLLLYPYILGFEVQGSIEFEDCSFVGTGAQAIYNYGNITGPGTSVTFTGTNTYSGYTAGYVLKPGRLGTLTGALTP